MQKIRLLVFSKFAMVRAALRLLLALAKDIEIIGEAETTQQAEQAIHELHPHVILIETVSTTGPAIPKLTARPARAGKIVILSNYGDARVVRAMLKAGVTAYVLKQSTDAELFLAIRSAAQGRKFLDPSLIDEIAFEGGTGAGQAEGESVLSKRELQVLGQMVRGYSTAAIAKELRLSGKTVETYRARIYEKLDVHNRADLMRYAISVGLISVNERRLAWVLFTLGI